MHRLVCIVTCMLLFIANTSFNGKKLPQSYYIVIDKSKYELSVIDGDGWLVTYPVVFGNNDLGDKMMDGDRKTPEGLFTLITKRTHEKWDKMLMIDYPTKADSLKFIERKLPPEKIILLFLISNFCFNKNHTLNCFFSF